MLPNVKQGDIFFVMHHDNKISKLMAWFMSSKWSHSGLVHGVLEDRILVQETSDVQVIISDLNKYLEDPNVSLEVWAPQVGEYQRYCATERAYKKTHGLIYGYFQLISLGLRRVFKLFGINIPNFIRSNVVCCHVPSYAYSINPDVIGPISNDPEGCDTQELYEEVSKRCALVFSKT